MDHIMNELMNNNLLSTPHTICIHINCQLQRDTRHDFWATNKYNSEAWAVSDIASLCLKWLAGLHWFCGNFKELISMRVEYTDKTQRGGGVGLDGEGWVESKNAGSIN